jgi:hypothetical protein
VLDVISDAPFDVVSMLRCVAVPMLMPFPVSFSRYSRSVSKPMFRSMLRFGVFRSPFPMLRFGRRLR